MAETKGLSDSHLRHVGAMGPFRYVRFKLRQMARFRTSRPEPGNHRLRTLRPHYNIHRNKKYPLWGIFYSWRSMNIVRFYTYKFQFYREFTGIFLFRMLRFSKSTHRIVCQPQPHTGHFVGIRNHRVRKYIFYRVIYIRNLG